MLKGAKRPIFSTCEGSCGDPFVHVEQWPMGYDQAIIVLNPIKSWFRFERAGWRNLKNTRFWAILIRDFRKKSEKNDFFGLFKNVFFWPRYYKAILKKSKKWLFSKMDFSSLPSQNEKHLRFHKYIVLDLSYPRVKRLLCFLGVLAEVKSLEKKILKKAL